MNKVACPLFLFSGCTTYYYDAMGRVTDIQNSDGTVVSKDYMQGRTTLVDANGYQRIEEKDIYGRLIKVEEYTGTYPNASLYATTTYHYDVMGNLTDVYDAQNNHTEIHYDLLSRKINMTDPDMGYWQYWYDANGNLITQTDAKNQTIQFTYDNLNRIKNKHYASCATCTDVNYTYDETWSTNSKGRLTTVTDVSGSEKYYYDSLGRATTAVKTVDGASYQMDKVYDSLGRLTSITYPDNETVAYDYDEGGNLTGVSNYATFSNFNALGQAGTITYANGVTTTQQYNSMNNRLWSITTNSPTAGGLQNTSYLYDNTGNISTLTDIADASRTQTFIYDELNRLRFATSASFSPAPNNTLEYQYDKIGNMTFNTRVGSYYYFNDSHCINGGSTPHAVCQAGPNSYQYDPNGNMTTKNGQTTITYDFDNRASNMQGSNGSVTNVYDYSGQRVKKNGTVYIGKLYECTGGSCIKYIFAGSTRIASQSTSKTYFYHSDHLGSATIVTDERGYKAQETYYYPFGETRYNSGSATHYKFTGQEEDPETGLYYYGARYYDPALGRFVSADSIVQAASEPQTLNRYSYCDNNPLIYTDPSGHIFGIDDLTIGMLIAGMIKGAAIGTAIGGSVAAATGGDIGKGMLSGAIGGAIFGGAGEIIHGMEAAGTVASITKAGIHAAAGIAAGGINAGISGGNIGVGMLTGGLAAGIAAYIGAEYLPNNDATQVVGRVAVGGLVGGVTSAALGGSFGQGFAVGGSVALLGELLNDMSSPSRDGVIKNPPSLPERMKGALLMDLKDLVDPSLPNDRVRVFMKYEGMAVDLLAGAGATAGAQSISGFSSNVFRWEIGSWANKPPQLHFHLFPNMSYHLPYELKTWFYYNKAAILRWFK